MIVLTILINELISIELIEFVIFLNEHTVSTNHVLKFIGWINVPRLFLLFFDFALLTHFALFLVEFELNCLLDDTFSLHLLTDLSFDFLHLHCPIRWGYFYAQQILQELLKSGLLELIHLAERIL